MTPKELETRSHTVSPLKPLSELLRLFNRLLQAKAAEVGKPGRRYKS